MNINYRDRECQICKELDERIELAEGTGEAIPYEVKKYHHQISGDCPDLKAA